MSLFILNIIGILVLALAVAVGVCLSRYFKRKLDDIDGVCGVVTQRDKNVLGEFGESKPVR